MCRFSSLMTPAWTSLVLLCSLLTSACGSAPLLIEVSSSDSTQVEGRSTLLGVFDGVGFDSFSNFDVTAEQELADQGAHQDNILSAAFDNVTLACDEGNTLGFLDDVALSLSSANAGPVVFATLELDDASDAVSAPFELTDVDVAHILRDDDVAIAVAASGEQPDDDTQLTLSFDMTLLIDVDSSVIQEAWESAKPNG